jgi:lipoprotein NlpD
MILKRTIIRLLTLGMVAILLIGCRVSGNRHAPIEERNESARHASIEEPDTSSKRAQTSSRRGSQDAGAQFYIVQKGDTLFSIAFENGLDYREVAEQNNIENPAAIQIGQKIKLISSEDGTGDRSHVETTPLLPSLPTTRNIRTQPKVIKLPYSEQAVAQIERMQQEPGQSAVITVTHAPVVRIPQETDAAADDKLDWGLPTKGKLIGEYSESANRKGVDIAGNKGQAILASAAGKVVYSGSGLRGYGKLVIIKHNRTYLSAYAHNEQLLVKEGQNVQKGQEIAEMGNTDSDQVKLHFEIRKFGKPIDPAKFLNFPKS